MKRRDEILKAIAVIATAIEEAVKEAGPMGAPSGVIYAAVMATGISLDMYNAIIKAMINEKKITQKGYLLFPA